MAPKFGTSGLRGLVTDLTDCLVRDYTQAFLTAANIKGVLHVGRDLRPSSPRIAQTVVETATRAGVDVVDHGALPTPTLALAALVANEAAIMVTGSHIPADRNGLKFYKHGGEIQKCDEAAIVAALSRPLPKSQPHGTAKDSSAATEAYRDRYIDAFGTSALSGLRLGVYEHSSVARDILVEVLSGLGAEVVRLARTEQFVPVDTEAVDADTRSQLADWCRQNTLDALVSTDGDADRPMVTDATGSLVPGDVLGALTARRLKARVVCTPVSSNTMVEALDLFDEVKRTQIGSPFVIAAMSEMAGTDVVGYEANGGFILGFEATGPVGPIAPLMTRDCLLPIVTPLVAMREAGTDLASLVAALPPRFTASDRLTEVPSIRSGAWLAEMIDHSGQRQRVLGAGIPEAGIDLTDGLRITYADETVIHLRPSGNAPEFRCYTEAETPERAAKLLEHTLRVLRQAL